MKYWLLTTEYPPHFGGGIGTYCKEWAETLVRMGESISIFLPNREKKNYTVKFESGVRIIEFSPFLKNTSTFLGYETMQSFSFAEIVSVFIEKEGLPDWIEAQEYNGIAYYILQRKHLGERYFKDLKVLVTCHAPSFLYFEHNHVNTYKLPYFWIGEMEKYSIQAADVCVSPSFYLVECLQQRFNIRNDIKVLHNPLSTSVVTYNNNHNNTALFLAKLSPSKGILQTLQTFKHLWQSGYDFKLKLIGDQNFFYHAKQSTMGNRIRKEFSDSITNGLLEISGSMQPEEVQREISAARVVLIPSTVDNFPYTVLESMANKKVVLASKQGGQKEIISDNVNGLLFDHHEEGSFRSKVLDAFLMNDAQLQVIGNNASITIKNICSPDKYYNDKLAVLNKYVQNPVDSLNFKFIRETPKETTIDIKNADKNEVNGLLSVVVPYYNMGRYIDDTVNSVLQSTFRDIEIIIVNDGSEDAYSLQKLNELSKRGDIKVIHQENKGLAITRNIGAQVAIGNYLAFLDADDLVHPEYYSRAVEVLKTKSNVHFIGCWVQYFGGANGIWPALHPEPPYLLYHNMVNSSALVYNRSSFLKAGKNDSQFLYGMEDYDSVVNMVKSGLQGVVIPDVLFYYRVRKNSMARGFNTDNKSYLYQLLAVKHQKFYSKFASELTCLLNANGPGFSVENPTMDYHLYSSDSRRKRYLSKLLAKVKHQPLLRKVALLVYDKIK